MTKNQPETWLCGNQRVNVLMPERGIMRLMMIDPVGYEVRAPLPGLERSTVMKVDFIIEVLRANQRRFIGKCNRQSQQIIARLLAV